jgi:hypothetical protein
MSQQTKLQEFKQKIDIKVYENLTPREELIHKAAFKAGYNLGLKQRRSKIQYILTPKDQNNKPTEKVFCKVDKNKAKIIINKVLEYYGIEYDELCSEKRFKDIASIRSVCMNLLRDLIHVSQPNIGKLVGGKDHTTVIHHLRSKHLKSKLWKEGSQLWIDYEKIKNQLTDIKSIELV